MSWTLVAFMGVVALLAADLFVLARILRAAKTPQPEPGDRPSPEPGFVYYERPASDHGTAEAPEPPSSGSPGLLGQSDRRRSD